MKIRLDRNHSIAMYRHANRETMNEALDLPLARSAIDRDYLSRTRADLFDYLDKLPGTKVLPVFDGKVLLTGTGDDPNPELRLFSSHELPNFEYRAYLGKTIGAKELPDDSPIVLAVLNKEDALKIEPDVQNWHVLRRTGAGLSDLGAGIYAQSLALYNWNLSHGYCPKCGTATQLSQAGWVRICPADKHEIYPRTDPAIIVSVIDDQDRILLGSQGIWEENRWSILAGFVEAGESLTAAVTREIFEEAGVRVVEPKYLASQAWPFPYSLMMGFTAKVDPNHAKAELVPDGEEIEKLRWFSRDDIAREAKDLLLPGRMSISRALIEHWYGDKIISATEKGLK
jgi:NAD+ diphosphatase